MKAFLKNIGLVILFAGIGLIAYTSFGTIQENTGLWLGSIFILVGLIAYILINRFIE